MSEWLSVALLGLIEGFTEFLPVSSTGHLLIAEHYWLGARGEMFNVVIQGAAVLAVAAVFTNRLKQLALGWRAPQNRDYLLKIAVAFCLTAVGGLALKHAGFVLDKEKTTPVAWATLVGGVLFILAEWKLGTAPRSEHITWAVAITMGVGQLLAIIFPGSSRSGTTILLALFLGVGRPAATEFSFLLGIPTLLAASGKEMLDAVKHGDASHDPWTLVAFASAVSLITAFISVRWLIAYVRTHSFAVFGWYRVAAGLAVLLLLR